jgi:hypothetical protein
MNNSFLAPKSDGASRTAQEKKHRRHESENVQKIYIYIFLFTLSLSRLLLLLLQNSLLQVHFSFSRAPIRKSKRISIPFGGSHGLGRIRSAGLNQQSQLFIRCVPAYTFTLLLVAYDRRKVSKIAFLRFADGPMTQLVSYR